MAAAVAMPGRTTGHMVYPGVPSQTPTAEVVEDRRKASDGSTVVRRYSKGRLLGKGGFAKCYKFISLATGVECAGKVVAKTSLQKSRTKQKLLAEIRIHRALSHKNIVRFDSYFEDRTNVYIMLEICSNQTLMELVRRRKRLTEPEARFYSLQLLDAMRYMHGNRVIHRDLKLGNLFLNSTLDLKVGDLGLATLLSHDEERKRTICGTPNYIAPEILMNSPDGHSYEVDTWSFGVILYTMVVGKPPFETSDVKSTYRRIKHNTYSFPSSVPISESAKDLITRLLAHQPVHRPNLQATLRHAWFTEPGAMVPRRMPATCLSSRPHFAASDLMPAADAVAAILAAPVGGLVSRASTRRSAPVDAADPENAHIVPAAKGGDRTAGLSSQTTRAPLRSVDMNAHGGVAGHSRQQPLAASKPARTTSAHPGIQVYTGPENVALPAAPPAAPAPTAAGLARLSAPPPRAATPPRASHTPASGTASSASGAGAGVGARVPDVETLRKMHSTLSKSGAGRAGGRNLAGDLAAAGASHATLHTVGSNPAVPSGVPPTWVSVWVDYTSKYGVGYLLCNGCVGVYFNDSTKIVLASDGHHFEYIERSGTTTDPSSGAKRRLEAPRQAYTLDNYAPALKKKVTLLKHFKSHLLEEQEKKSHVAEEERASLAAGSSREDMPYLKKWIRTRHALIFRLSNKTVQVAFMDGTSITLSSELPRITYVGKEGERSYHALADLSAADRPDIAKRLKYTKDILHQLITGSRK